MVFKGAIMKYYEYVFCVLVYRNVFDIKYLVESINENVNDAKVVIVNSFFDEKSKQEINECAISYGCDFVNVENKGYSYGNNEGIYYICNKYEFKYLIISNPDIIVKRFPNSELISDACITGPIIKTIQGKLQNPYWAKENYLGEWMLYFGFKYRIGFFRIMTYAINKIIRNFVMGLYKVIRKECFYTYACHGSFMIIPYGILHRILPVFDDKMFLFNEEALLAYKAKKNNIRICINKNIEVVHKEDGSLKMSNVNEFNRQRESFIYYFSKRKHI